MATPVAVRRYPSKLLQASQSSLLVWVKSWMHWSHSIRIVWQAEFTLEDYLDQMEQLQNMGNINSMLEMMPGMSKNKLKDIQIDEKDMARTKAIILSMTPAERRNPKIINGSRRKRIAAGSGMKVQDVNRLLKQYEQSQVLMKQFGGMASGKKGKKGGGKFKLPFGM